MIEKNRIAELVIEKLTPDQFLIEVTVSATNVINIMVDSDTGISINQIVEISRFVESNLDRETDDFELSVYSAGLTEPFVLLRQYKKNIDTEIEVLFKNGQKVAGVLISANEKEIELEVTTKEKIEGSKKKELITKVQKIEFSEIKEAKKVLKF